MCRANTQQNASLKAEQFLNPSSYPNTENPSPPPPEKLRSSLSFFELDPDTFHTAFRVIFPRFRRRDCLLFFLYFYLLMPGVPKSHKAECSGNPSVRPYTAGDQKILHLSYACTPPGIRARKVCATLEISQGQIFWPRQACLSVLAWDNLLFFLHGRYVKSLFLYTRPCRAPCVSNVPSGSRPTQPKPWVFKVSLWLCW